MFFLVDFHIKYNVCDSYSLTIIADGIYKSTLGRAALFSALVSLLSYGNAYCGISDYSRFCDMRIKGCTTFYQLENKFKQPSPLVAFSKVPDRMCDKTSPIIKKF